MFAPLWQLTHCQSLFWGTFWQVCIKKLLSFCIRPLFTYAFLNSTKQGDDLLIIQIQWYCLRVLRIIKMFLNCHRIVSIVSLDAIFFIPSILESLTLRNIKIISPNLKMAWKWKAGRILESGNETNTINNLVNNVGQDITDYDRRFRG